jgi:hypothetical protein
VIVFTIVIALVAALLTFELAKIDWIGPIRASAGLTLISYIDFHIINYFYTIDINSMMAVFFGASFIGMCTHKAFEYFHIAAAAVFFAGIFTYVTPYWSGMGGALGFSAFLSVVFSFYIGKFIDKLSS